MVSTPIKCIVCGDEPHAYWDGSDGGLIVCSHCAIEILSRGLTWGVLQLTVPILCNAFGEALFQNGAQLGLDSD